MKRAILTAIILLAGSSLSVEKTQAYPVTIYIKAEVDSVEDTYNYLEGKINVGDIITGYYTYESTTVDTNPLPDGADYWHYSPPAGIYLTAGGWNFQTDTSDVEFHVALRNDVQSEVKDIYAIASYNNSELANGSPVDKISWQLNDYSGTALSSDALPLTAPVLSDWQFNLLRIIGEKSNFFGIDAYVTSAIPEPSSILLIALGTLFLCRKNK